MFKSLLTSIAFAACVGAAPAIAQSPPQSGAVATIEAARAYLDAYGDLNVDVLEELYAEDADFIDETSRLMPNPFIWEGRDAILAGIRGWRQDSVDHISYELTSVFEAANRVVFVGSVVTDLRGPDGPARYRFPTITIVTLAGGLVVEHRDYVDYHGAERIQ